MWPLLLGTYVAGVLISAGMLTARLGSTRILELHPRAAYPIFLICWPVAWLLGLGVTLIVIWALLGSALLNRGGLR